MYDDDSAFFGDEPEERQDSRRDRDRDRDRDDDDRKPKVKRPVRVTVERRVGPGADGLVLYYRATVVNERTFLPGPEGKKVGYALLLVDGNVVQIPERDIVGWFAAPR